jgi:ribosomal protein L37E
MTRHLCDFCGTYFDEPVVIEHTEHLGEFQRRYTEEQCPICGSDSFSDADDCPQCGKPKPADVILCQDCRQNLRRRIVDFFDTLTAEEESQFDDWMDGESITSREEWS